MSQPPEPDNSAYAPYVDILTGPPVRIPDQLPTQAVREPRFHLSDVQTVLGFTVVFVFLILLGVKVFECIRVCTDQRDWDQALDPLVAAGLTAVGSVIGYFFGRDHRDP